MSTQGDNFRVIAGRYRLEATIGRGGMGVVWRASDHLLGRRVAVKELPLDDTLSTAEARRVRDHVLREARAVAQLRHPHVIVVHDVVEDGERPFLVMELIEGGSLADRIAGHGPVDAVEAARIGVALLGALRAAHAAGVLHRDIKPANVLIAEDGRVVLTDFGVAQVSGATTLTGPDSFVGSPEYTAPERMAGLRGGPESDLWSLGALLCTAVSGESPFRRDSLGGIVNAVLAGEIRPPAQAGPILPVVRGLLERDPYRRLDAVTAERMLRAFLDTGRVGGREQRSRRGVLAAVLLVAAMVGAGVSGAALLMNEVGDGGRVPSPGSSESGTAASSTGPTAASSTGPTAASPTGPTAASPAGSTDTSSTGPAGTSSTGPAGPSASRSAAGSEEPSFAPPSTPPPASSETNRR
ncbi:protein kinase [Streptomyces sp. NPDC090106]|uniref:serine/threonine-protein kinase n=1 Tax=Streptomyces sp. NPDC090106 TaxID=3365946 RepID=UPI0037FB1B39